jgi:adenosylcobinamide-phosphate synthase
MVWPMFGLVPESRIDPVVILFLGLMLDAFVGDMRPLFRAIPHPVVLVGRLIEFLESRLNRPERGPQTRFLRGALTVFLVGGLALLAAWGVLSITRQIPGGWLIELFLVVTLVAQRSLYDHVAAVARALDEGGVPAGRVAVSHIVGRDPRTLDDHGIARAATESLFENFADGVVAPAFWYVVAGLPGLFLCKAVNTLDSMIGHRNPRYAAFGAIAARLDTAMNFLPARFAGLVIAIAAAFAPHGKPFAALRTILRDSHKHKSVNAGWPEAAAAGALGLALAGPRQYDGVMVDDPWIGDGRARVNSDDIRRALFLFVLACLIHAALIGGLAMARDAAGL